jgi:hypothetical protein
MKGRLRPDGACPVGFQRINELYPISAKAMKGLYDEQKKYIRNFKKAILMVAGAAVQKLMMTIDKEQEVLMKIADMAIDTFHAESSLLRLMKLTEKNGEENVAVLKDIVDCFYLMMPQTALTNMVKMP